MIFCVSHGVREKTRGLCSTTLELVPLQQPLQWTWLWAYSKHVLLYPLPRGTRVPSMDRHTCCFVYLCSKWSYPLSHLLSPKWSHGATISNSGINVWFTLGPISENVSSNCWPFWGRFRSYCLVGESMSLGGGRICELRGYSPNFLFAHYALCLWLICEVSTFCSCHHACSLLPCLPGMTDSSVWN